MFWLQNLCSTQIQRHKIPVIGEAKVQITYHDQEAVLLVVITGNGGPVLMDCDWLSQTGRSAAVV